MSARRPCSPAPRSQNLRAHEDGTLAERARAAVAALADCTVCPRACGADRRGRPLGRVGDPRNYCGTGRRAIVSSSFPHFGEESCLVSTGGSGTIFFGGCNLACGFCQNYDLSCGREGQELGAAELAGRMLELQERGCHNVNLVTPSHVVPQILEALVLAVEDGLRLPLVYNTSGFDRLETLRWLDGVVDVYMPDLKTLDAEKARRWMNAPAYPAVAKAALREMFRQVGDLVLDERGIARRGVLVRHLVMPESGSDTAEVCRFLAEELGPDTYVNLMHQYHPAGQAHEHPELRRRPTSPELRAALEAARSAGVRRLDGIARRR